MIYEGNHDCPETIDCAEVVQMGGRVKGGVIEELELRPDFYRYCRQTSAGEDQKNNEELEIRVSIRSSKLPSIELFTLRNVKPANYRLVLVAIPRENEKSTSK